MSIEIQMRRQFNTLFMGETNTSTSTPRACELFTMVSCLDNSTRHVSVCLQLTLITIRMQLITPITFTPLFIYLFNLFIYYFIIIIVFTYEYVLVGQSFCSSQGSQLINIVGDLFLLADCTSPPGTTKVIQYPPAYLQGLEKYLTHGSHWMVRESILPEM